MKWGVRKQHATPSARCEEENAEGRGTKGKGKAFSFSPLSWLAKLAAKDKPGAGAATKRAPAPASTPKNTAAAAAPAFPSSCLPKRTGPSPGAAVTLTPGSSSPPRRSTADAAVPRRLSVGNDNADSVAARRQSCRHARRHRSVGGDRELPPLGRLIPFSLSGSPARAAAAAPSDTDAAAWAGRAGARRHRRRRRSSRRLSVSGGGGRRASFSGSGRMVLPPRVRVVRSPRRTAAGSVAPAELDSLAVVRRTRDPQRAFRESMVEMIASASAGASGPRPEELERLLACYLSLNADEHHDCIVKVFRQVWFEYVSLLPRPDPEAAGRRRRPPPTARRY